MWSIGGTASGDGRSASRASFWSAPIAGLVVLWLWLAFSSGGYIPAHWLPAGLALGLFGLVAALLGAYPRRPGQLSLSLLAVLGGYGVWVALSALWADSPTRVWMEGARTFTYLLVIALALLYFTDASARRVFRYLVVAAGLAILAACVAKLWSTDSIASLFLEQRFSYPVSASNHAGALFLVTFWPLMWLASASKERAPVRGVALGVATGLLSLAVMTQSRGAVWSLGLSLVFMFVISPARLRLLFYLVVPALLMVYEFPMLNRYWVEGPEAVGGGVGARTLLVAAVIAAFIGMILALLEPWVKVSRRMKAIFGTVVMLAVIGGAVFWGITSTSDVGGPFKWASQAWRQFTGVSTQAAAPEGSSRFALVSSTGRVQIWRVAIQEFESAPVLGVGADNFVFEYDRLRKSESYKPQQAHSIELQVLGETGIIGGLLFFGGILLALGAWLWPRCTAGWRGARTTWLARPKTGQPPGTSGVSARLCNPRWGDDPRSYGWEMALLAGAAYWLIHTSVDWIWQMAGVTVPALLFLAAGVAGVDARAGVLWPRLQRWMSLGSRPTGQLAPAAAAKQAPAPDPMAPTGQVAPAGRDEPAQSLVSHVFRALLVALSAVVLLGAGLPYLSIQYQDSALAVAETDGLRAANRAAAARYLLPTDPGPYLTQAEIYEKAATRALESTGPEAAGAVLDNLALAVGSYEKAIALEAADWTTHYHAGIAMLNMMLATGYLEDWKSLKDAGQTTPTLAAVQDWSALAGLQTEVASPGLTPGSLAQDELTRAQAADLRRQSGEQLAARTLAFLQAAKERNPLASQIDDAIKVTNDSKPQGDN